MDFRSGKDELYISQIDSIKASLKQYAIKNINSNIRIKIDEVLSRQNMNAFVSTINDNILHCYHDKLTYQLNHLLLL